MDFRRIEDALASAVGSVFHYEALKATYPYCVWAEESQAGEAFADNAMEEQAVRGTIDYFTLKEGDPAVKTIQNALAAADVHFYLNSVQHEEDTGAIHYEWVWEMWLD